MPYPTGTITAMSHGFLDPPTAEASTTVAPPRLVIQLFTDFLPNAAPLGQLRFDRLRINHLFHDRQVLWQTCCAWLPWT